MIRVPSFTRLFPAVLAALPAEKVVLVALSLGTAAVLTLLMGF